MSRQQGRRHKAADTAHAKAMAELRSLLQSNSSCLVTGKLPYPLPKHENIVRLLAQWKEGGHQPAPIKLYQAPPAEYKKTGAREIWFVQCSKCNFVIYLSAKESSYSYYSNSIELIPYLHVKHAVFGWGWYWDWNFPDTPWTPEWDSSSGAWQCSSIKAKGVKANDSWLAPDTF